MSDLQNALDRVETAEYQFFEELALIVEAARLVADPNIAAALLVYDEASEDHADEVAYVQAIVAAALTPGEDG